MPSPFCSELRYVTWSPLGGSCKKLGHSVYGIKLFGGQRGYCALKASLH